MQQITKNNILDLLKADLKAAENLKNNQDALIAKWKSEYDGELYGNEGKATVGKSRIVSRDIKKQSEWQHSSIVDPFVGTSEIIKCAPITFEDVKAARQNELLLNTQFCRKFDRYNFITKAVKVLDQEGTVVIQTGWDYKDKVVKKTTKVVATSDDGLEVTIDDEVEETIVLKNQPTAKVCRNSDIYIDPTCQDNLEDAQFVIYRYETDLSTLKQDPKYSDIDKIQDEEGSKSADWKNPDKTDFKFTDSPRKKLLVYEYWGNYDVDGDGIAEPIVCSWVGNTVIRLENNPYPDGKPPFLVVPFNSVPFKIHGEANAELIGDNQKVKTAITRGILDNMAKSNNGQVGVRKNVLDPANKRRFNDGHNFEFQGTVQDFWHGSYNPIPNSAFEMIALQNNEIESLTGIKSFSGGINAGSLGATATGARGALDATATRKMNIVRNVAENLVKPLIRKWMSYNAAFLGEEEVIRVTNEEFVPIKQDDLEGKIDIDINIATSEDNAAKAQELAFILQTLAPNEDPSVRRELMATYMDLMRLPEQAKKTRNYEPQPDPMAEQAKQLELENLQLQNELIKAQIQNELASASEDTADKELKLARARVERARARKLGSDADINDLRFIKEDEGISHAESMELERFKFNNKLKQDLLRYRANLRQMQIQKSAGDKDIGVLE